MNPSNSIPSTVASLSFSFLSTQEVRRISVKRIVNPVLLDDLNRPNLDGLYDPALGPSDRQDICATCRLTYFTCPGHFGHIELASPVFHPLFMLNMYNLLRGTCLFCHKFKLGRSTLVKLTAKLRLIEHGLLVAAQGLDDTVLKDGKGKGGDEDEDEDEVESVDDFEARINGYVEGHLQRASTSKRDHYKDGLVYQARKDVINELLKAALARKKCLNCDAHGFTYRKEGHTKIIRYDLTPKQKREHQAVGLKFSNILMSSPSAHEPVPSAQNGVDAEGSESEISQDEGVGESTFSDDGMDVDQGDDPAPQVHQLPKAANGKVKTARGRKEVIMMPEECRAHLRRLFVTEPIVCSLLFGRHGPFAPLSAEGFSWASADIFFQDIIPVTPTRFRPPAKLGETLFEHPQNELLTKVLNTCVRLRDIQMELRAASMKGSSIGAEARSKLLGTMTEALVVLQSDVNSFVDSNKNPAPMRQGKLPPSGVKQLLEKKEGIFRKNMMGKRVNYAARSVISPDANIEPNEIGIPPVFARKLTFPVPVTPANVQEMRTLVINGPKNYPGATMIEYEDGHQQSLDKLSHEQRNAIANQLLTPQEGEHAASSRHGLYTRTPARPKKVYRHLRDGDVLILNRQPTLHKPSMMVHRAKVLQGEKTIRMHYANCNSYNADFDGDEMNIHFPQNEVARAEAMFIANTDNQYLVPTSGKPLRGLIQDHVVAGVWMTNQDTFFTREEYFQLLYGALRPEDDYTGRLVTLPPAIWKPKPLWTGKQIISTVLKNITPHSLHGLNVQSKAKVPGKLWGNDSQEDVVLFMDGELMSGVLDKSSFGATEYGLVHSVYELYGADIAGKLLGVLSRLFTKYLQHRAFTCRMDDLTLTPTGDACRTDLIQKGRNLGTEGAVENFPSLSSVPAAEKADALSGMLREILRDDSKMAGLDVTVKTKLAELTKSIADACIPHNLHRKFPHNHMQAMTLSGAKGSAVNAQQISCALGQQELEGRRVPVMVSGKTLPSFKAFETKAIAGGYVASRFLTGVKPQEFYFHCMAGREGLIDTAVKTSRSGYLQRCLIKHLEGLRVHYDNTVRGSDSSIYQFYYGGDGLDITKQKHLYQFEFTARNQETLIKRYKPDNLNGVVDDEIAIDHMKKVIKRSAQRPDKNTPAKRDKYETAMSLFNPTRHLGSTSEKFAEKVQQYLKENPNQLLKTKGLEQKMKYRNGLLSLTRFKMLMNVKYMRAMVEPGEAVGLLASQGVGEPSTQMTLNTFHFAGHGAANVTLGIPRLREIVMTASTKPKTPSMIVPVRKDVARGDIEVFCKKANRLTLSQLVDTVTVKERLAVNGLARSKEYIVDLAFFPAEEYRKEHDVEPSEILAAFAATFPLMFKKEVLTEMKKVDADLKGQKAELGKGKAAKESAAGRAANGGGDEDDGKDQGTSRRRNEENSEMGDGDAEDEKRARQSKQQATYESDDDREGDEDEDYDESAAIEAAYADGRENDAISVDQDEDGKSKEKVRRKGKGLRAQVEAVEQSFMELFSFTKSFSFKEDGCTIGLEFNSSMPKLLLVGVVERTCLKTVIREIPGITDCFPGQPEKDGSVKLTTNGSNFRGLWEFSSSSDESMIDEDEIYSNDIYAFLCTYGVEAARQAILREVGSVFKAYSIDVDMRHLELIADYMTFDGGYKPFNRKGIATNSSPLLKASFETTASFISDATLYGDFDNLSSPSGNIVVGRPSTTGTGAFDVLTAVQ